MRSNTTLHYHNLAQIIRILESASISSTRSTLKGNSIQVVVKFTDVAGNPGVGYYPIPSSDISNHKFWDATFVRKCFRTVAIGSAARNAFDEWCGTNPKVLRDLQKLVIEAAKKEYAEGDATKRKNAANVEKCRKALSEWMIHSFKHGIEQDEILQIMRESLIKSTMSE